MVFTPVADRELRIRARQPATYRLRMYVIVVATIVLVGMLLNFARFRSLAATGHTIFGALGVLAAFFCLFEGLRQTVDCLAEEKRGGTLGFLFLADLNAYDIVLGKFAAASLNSFYGLLAFFPVLAVPTLFGGVTAGEVFRLALALTATLLFSLAAGMAISARSRHPLKAWVAAGALVLGLGLGPKIINEVFFSGGSRFAPWLSPLNPCMTALEPDHSSRSGEYWFSLLVAYALAGLGFCLACWEVRRNWRDSATHAPSAPQGWPWRWLKPLLQRPAQSARLQRLKQEQPLEWLGLRSQGHARLLWPLVLLVCVGMVLLRWSQGSLWSAGDDLLFGLALPFFWIVKIWITVSACNLMVDLRQEGVLDLLLITPQRTSEVTHAFARALARAFSPPLIAGAVFLLLLQVVDYFIPQPDRHLAQIPFLWLLSFLYLSLNALDLFALGWTGLWFGLTAPKLQTAILRTLLTVIGLPWLVVLIPCVGVVLMILSPVWSLLLIRWAKARLESQFRHVLSEPAANIQQQSWWRPIWDMLPPMEMHLAKDSPKQKGGGITPPPS